MHTWFWCLSFGLLCFIQPALTGAADLDIPEDLKAYARQVESVVQLAQTCDMHLRLGGRAELSKPTCIDFLMHVMSVTNVEPARWAHWRHRAVQVAQSSNQDLQRRWRIFDAVLKANLDIVHGVIYYIQSLHN